MRARKAGVIPVAVLCLMGIVAGPASSVTSSHSPTTPYSSAATNSVRSRDAADPFDSTAMRDYLSTRTGSITGGIEDLDTGQIFLYRPGVREQTASIVKVDILETLLWQEQSAHETLDATDQSIAEGMIEQSDNDDASDLWNDIGGAAGVAAYNRVIGLTSTTPGADGYWGVTLTTPADQLNLLGHLVLSNDVLDPASRAYELNLMENVTSWEDWGVSSGPTAGTTVALKNGWVTIVGTDWQVNSIGYVDGSGRRYLVAVMTTGDPSEDYGISTTEGVSTRIWDSL